MKIKLFEEYNSFDLEELASGLCAELSDIINEDLDYDIVKEENFIRIQSFGYIERLKVDRNRIEKSINEFKLLYPEIKDWYIVHFTQSEENSRGKFKCLILEGSWIKKIMNSVHPYKGTIRSLEDTYILVDDNNNFFFMEEENTMLIQCCYHNFWQYFQSKYDFVYQETELFLESIQEDLFNTKNHTILSLDLNSPTKTLLSRYFKTEGYIPE